MPPPAAGQDTVQGALACCMADKILAPSPERMGSLQPWLERRRVVAEDHPRYHLRA